MTSYYRVICDQCGEKFSYDGAEEKEALGWIEVWVGDDRQKDFCSQACMIDFYNGDEEDE